jgi:4-amino-4-deoxy-L-arabinose transferase-like glycosyltransferase
VEPLASPDFDAFGCSERKLERVLWAFVALGITLRLLVYLLQMPVWTDEAKLATSLLDRGYAGLLEPLAYGQVAPFPFVWLVKASTTLFGFSELSLRMVAVVAAIASVLLMRHVARRLFTGSALLFSMSLFAVSYYPIRHGAEVKPYATDLLVSLAVTAVAVEWLRRPERARWLALLAAIAPVAVLFSYPAIFVLCGVLAALALPVWREGRWSGRAAWAAGVLMTAGTFAATYVLMTAERYERSRTKPWVDGFPSWDHPLGPLSWIVRAHTGRTFGYPIGADDGGSILTFAAFATGVWFLFRAHKRALAGVLLGPFAMGFGAALIHRYPYGGSGRVTQYLVPAICLVAGLGAARWTRTRRRAQIGVLASLFLFGSFLGVASIVRPYRDRADRDCRDFSRWLWGTESRNAVLVDAWEDLELEFARPDDRVWYPGGEDYRVDQRIYRAREKSPDLASVSEEHPLRVVFLGSVVQSKPDELESWLRSMTERYEPAGRVRYRLGPFREQHGREDWLEVFTFRPRAP